MVNFCCVAECKNEYYPGCGFSFHRFPRDESMREKWSKVVPGKIVKTSLVCSKKFEISKDDKLPNLLCKSCTNSLEITYTFIKQARDVNITLLNLISGQTTSVIIKAGQHQENLNRTVENYSENLFECFNDTDSQSPFKVIKTSQSIDQDFYKKQKKEDNKPHYVVTPLERNQAVSVTHNEPYTIKTEQIQDNNKSGDKDVKACPLCRKKFVSKVWFSRHMEKEHMGSRQFACDQCNKSFLTPRRLLQHRDSHSRERRFACDACGKSFYKRKQLTAHARAHSDDRPYACDQCHMTFKIKSILTSHMKVHENDKAFLCSICGRGFRTASHLDCHSRLHTGVKPFACSQCPFRARFTASLRRHELRHRADKRHVCGRCQKGFYESGALARHMRTHTGERPFQCPSCARAFTDGSKRKVHMMRVHQLALEDIPLMHRDGRPVEL